VCFFRLLDRKFNEDSKNVLKTVILSLQLGFYPKLSFQTVLLTVYNLTPLFSLTLSDFVVFLYVIR